MVWGQLKQLFRQLNSLKSHDSFKGRKNKNKNGNSPKKIKKIISSDNQGGDRDFIFTLQQSKNRPVSQYSQYHHPLSLNCSIPFHSYQYQPLPLLPVPVYPSTYLSLSYHPILTFPTFPFHLPLITTFPIFPFLYLHFPNFPSLPYLPYLPFLALFPYTFPTFSTFPTYPSFLYLHLPTFPSLPSLPYLTFPTLPSLPYLPYLTFHTFPSLPYFPYIFPNSPSLPSLPFPTFPSLSFLYVTFIFLFQP